MNSVMGSFVMGVISGIVASGVVFLFSKVYQWWRVFKDSPYSGNWKGTIYAITPETESGNLDAIVQGGLPVKHDIYKIKHNKKTGIITGIIQREHPLEQKHRKWNLTGIIDGKNYIIFSFWSQDGSVKSNGCVYAEHIGDFKYVGYYLEEHDKNVIDKTPIMLVKCVSD